jgi:hypothetical protein
MSAKAIARKTFPINVVFLNAQGLRMASRISAFLDLIAQALDSPTCGHFSSVTA